VRTLRPLAPLDGAARSAVLVRLYVLGRSAIAPHWAAEMCREGIIRRAHDPIAILWELTPKGWTLANQLFPPTPENS
jgi:hypothetical protein